MIIYIIFDIPDDYLELPLKTRQLLVMAAMGHACIPCLDGRYGQRTLEQWQDFIEACSENGRPRVKLALTRS